MISADAIYFDNLLKNLKDTSNLTLLEKNNFWLKIYESLEKDIRDKNLENLPQIMALLYPDFLFDRDGRPIASLINYKNNNFSISISEADNCQIATIDKNLKCEFNFYKSIRGKCQADHYWPHSLGGPTILENRILLCRFHNLAKSNSIMQGFWTHYPIWLTPYLNRMYNLKS